MECRRVFPSDFELFLASQSPRRQSLLRAIGVPFRVVASLAEEITAGASLYRLAQANAEAKARQAVLSDDAAAGAFVLGADTVVAVDERILGKAGSEGEAADMLRLLSGRTHRVISGVAVAQGSEIAGRHGGESRLEAAYAVTEVRFAPLSDAQIASYVASGEWRDKAGAYAIQGLAGTFVTGISGEYSNVVGLPLCVTARLFHNLGFDLVQGRWS